MPHERKIQFDVLTDFKVLSDEADHRLDEYELQDEPGLQEWFAAVKETIIQIRDCKSVKDIQYPPELKVFLGDENRKKDESAVPEDKETLHTGVPTESAENKAMKEIKEQTLQIPVIQLNASGENISESGRKLNKNVAPALSTSKKFNPSVLLHPISTPKMDMNFNKSVFGSNKSQNLMQTPVLNRTYEKINKTLLKDSASPMKHFKSKVLNVYSDVGMKTRSASKKQSELENNVMDSNKKNTRSGSKRKSSSKNETSKKQKMDIHDTTTSSSKTKPTRHPLHDKNNLKAFVTSENKSKLSAVIQPPMLPKTSVVSKEKQILEEIKKKEEKANQNIKRVLAERQQKAEQNKKTREEKRVKTLQKRMLIEKEKEQQLLERRETEAKLSQAKVTKENAKNPVKKTRAKELIEQHVKESKSSVLSAPKQNETDADILVKTPVNKKLDENKIESYELTPLPDSSTYNFSEDEDDKPSGKPIPEWAQGVFLKTALIQQYYNPVDTDALFGSYVNPPDLVEIFKVNKKRYHKRTSSAVWNSPPNRSYHN